MCCGFLIITFWVAVIKVYIKLDIKNPIIRINTGFKGYSSTKKVTILPRIYHN